MVKAQLNEVRVSEWYSFEDLLSNLHSFVYKLLEPFLAFKVAHESSNAAPTSSNKIQVPATEAKGAEPSSEHSPAPLASEESVSEFIAQVKNLVKYVN